MATRAGERLIAAQPGVVEEETPQLDLLPRQQVVGRNLGRRKPARQVERVRRFGRNRRGGEENADDGGEDEVTNGHQSKSLRAPVD
jgi:hypothetical protein